MTQGEGETQDIRGKPHPSVPPDLLTPGASISCPDPRTHGPHGAPSPTRERAGSRQHGDPNTTSKRIQIQIRTSPLRRLLPHPPLLGLPQPRHPLVHPELCDEPGVRARDAAAGTDDAEGLVERHAPGDDEEGDGDARAPGHAPHAVHEHAPVRLRQRAADPPDGVVEVVEQVVVRAVVDGHAEVLDGARVAVRGPAHDGQDVGDAQLLDDGRGGGGVQVGDEQAWDDLAGLGKEVVEGRSLDARIAQGAPVEVVIINGHGTQHGHDGVCPWWGAMSGK